MILASLTLQSRVYVENRICPAPKTQSIHGSAGGAQSTLGTLFAEMASLPEVIEQNTSVRSFMSPVRKTGRSYLRRATTVARSMATARARYWPWLWTARSRPGCARS